MRGETQTIMKKKKKTQLLWIKLNKRVKHLKQTNIVLTYTFEFWKLLFRSEFEQFFDNSLREKKKNI